MNADRNDSFHIDKGSKCYLNMKVLQREIITRSALQGAPLSMVPFTLCVFAFLRISIRAQRLQQLRVRCVSVRLWDQRSILQDNNGKPRRNSEIMWTLHLNKSLSFFPMSPKHIIAEPTFLHLLSTQSIFHTLCESTGASEDRKPWLTHIVWEYTDYLWGKWWEKLFRGSFGEQRASPALF